jgi:hypothetical protein
MVQKEAELVSLNLADFYEPHEGQQAFHDSKAKVKVAEQGRRYGKSRQSLWEMIRVFWEAAAEIPVPNSVIPPFHAWIVAPSFPQARQVWNELISFLPPQMVAPGGIRQDEKMIYLRGTPNRSWGLIEVKSAHDPESLQTAGLDFLWITESQDIKDTAFQKLLPTLRSPNRLGRAVFEGIPSLWNDHWFRRVVVTAQEGRKGYEAFHATAFDNPLLNDEQKAEIEMDKEILPMRIWRRLYLAEFSEEAGYFKNISACVAGDLLPEPIGNTEYVAGLDLGRKLDASVLMVMDASSRKVVHHMAWEDGTSWILQRESMVKQHEMWNFSSIIIDATGMGGDIFTQELQEHALPVQPFIFTQSSRETLLQTLAVSLERQTVSFPAVPQLLRQLRAFQYRKLPSGQYKVEAPPGEHDDEVFALALALTACAEAPSSVPMGNSYRRARYVPTQSEANHGILGGETKGAKMMRARRLSRLEERTEKARLW